MKIQYRDCVAVALSAVMFVATYAAIFVAGVWVSSMFHPKTPYQATLPDQDVASEVVTQEQPSDREVDEISRQARQEGLSEAEWDSQHEPDVEGAQTPSFGSLPSRESWAAEFNHAKREKIKDGYWICSGCGVTPPEVGKQSHDAHHIVSVKRIETERYSDGRLRWKPEMKWDKRNLIMLCRPSVDKRRHPDDKGCHFLIGHLGQNWSVSNPNVQEDAADLFLKTNPNCNYLELSATKRAEYRNTMLPVPTRRSRLTIPSKTVIAP